MTGAFSPSVDMEILLKEMPSTADFTAADSSDRDRMFVEVSLHGFMHNVESYWLRPLHVGETMVGR